jgi:hypothetical protein
MTLVEKGLFDYEIRNLMTKKLQCRAKPWIWWGFGQLRFRPPWAGLRTYPAKKWSGAGGSTSVWNLSYFSQLVIEPFLIGRVFSILPRMIVVNRSTWPTLWAKRGR